MCVVSLMCAAPARADLLTTILTDYANDNRIDPCRYSPKVLSQLKQLISNDLDAYSDLGAAVDDALSRRAQGVCNKGQDPAGLKRRAVGHRRGGATAGLRRRRLDLVGRRTAGADAPGPDGPREAGPDARRAADRGARRRSRPATRS